jgi:DNA-binding NarL/FixJ family response regulator
VIRILLADDQTLVRAGFRGLLERSDDFLIVAEAANGIEAVERTLATHPDVVLMDVRMPDVDGLEATRRIMADPRLVGVRVIVLTTFDVDEYVFEALRAGASGFLLKDVEPEELRHAVRVVARGDALLSPGVTRRLIADFVARGAVTTASAQRLAPLTDREREVLVLVATGATNDEIAEQLTLSTATVKTHVSRAMSKLDARDRAQLVVIAYETGLVTPGRSDITLP